MVGREDPLCSVKAAETAHAGIARSELAIFEDCGQFAWIENNEYMEFVNRFLRDWGHRSLLIKKTRKPMNVDQLY